MIEFHIHTLWTKHNFSTSIPFSNHPSPPNYHSTIASDHGSHKGFNSIKIQQPISLNIVKKSSRERERDRSRKIKSRTRGTSDECSGPRVTANLFKIASGSGDEGLNGGSKAKFRFTRPREKRRMQISGSNLVQRIEPKWTLSYSFIFRIEFGIELGNLWCRFDGSKDSW